MNKNGELEVDQPTVVIISDEVDFARTVMGRWQTERAVPAFTQMSSDLWNGANAGSFDLAIVGPVAGGRLAPVLKALDSPTRATIFVGDSAQVQTVRDGHPRVLALRRSEDWVDALVVLGAEALRRVEAIHRALRAEQGAMTNHRQSTLGRYMIEMRHSFNNALTSVLGNAELLLLEPGALSTTVREQVDTIHSMTMRMHEIIQRFNSLDTEMQFAERQSQAETGRPARAFAPASDNVQ